MVNPILSSPIPRARRMVSTQSRGEPFTVQSSSPLSKPSCNGTMVRSCISQARYIAKVFSR